MNLVTKEFISSKPSEAGVLILSQFTGASRELPESVIVSPYNFDQFAEALHSGLCMPRNEQKKRAELKNFLPIPTLVALDLDGTLAPLVMKASRARMKASLKRKLEKLIEFLPILIIFGRGLDVLELTTLEKTSRSDL